MQNDAANLSETQIHYGCQKGKCGDDLTWILNSEGTLVISGTGVMYDYGYDVDLPPYDINSVRSVIIEEGVTSIGFDAFR